jgi:hypothetical protein
MVCDEDSDPIPKLRIVAGTKLDSRQYEAFALDVGDGIAGRAYKSRAIRIFRKPDSHGGLKKHAYLRIPGEPVHEALFCIPLIHKDDPNVIYGILNLGTFKRNTAEVLSVLESEASVEWLGSNAQSYVLQRLIDIMDN